MGRSVMANRTKLSDAIGWGIEKGLFYLIYVIFAIVLINQALLIYSTLGINEIENFIVNQYGVLITPNIGTITTIAAVFIGIYFTVLSILGTIKANSLMALLDDNNLKKLVKFISHAIISAFVVVFYSLITATIKNEFIQSFIYISLLAVMFLTSLRFSASILIIYAHDLNKIRDNINADKREKERFNHVLYHLEQYLNSKEIEKLEKNSEKITPIRPEK